MTCFCNFYVHRVDGGALFCVPGTMASCKNSELSMMTGRPGLGERIKKGKAYICIHPTLPFCKTVQYIHKAYILHRSPVWCAHTVCIFSYHNFYRRAELLQYCLIPGSTFHREQRPGGGGKAWKQFLIALTKRSRKKFVDF